MPTTSSIEKIVQIVNSVVSSYNNSEMNICLFTYFSGELYNTKVFHGINININQNQANVQIKKRNEFIGYNTSSTLPTIHYLSN